MRWLARAAACLLPLLLAACAAAEPSQPTAPDPAVREEVLRAPLTAADGGARSIVVRLCRPEGTGPVPLVVINHGSPPNAAARPGVRPAACGSEAVTWFLRRGFAVALPLRRGYGESGGAWAEGYGSCDSPDYVAAGQETARDIRAALDAVHALPGIRRDGTVVVGQSAGGWGTVALAADPPPDVVAMVSMAGGRGGHSGGMPNVNCRPDLLARDAGRLGATARVPMLWIYTANDSYFEPRIVSALHAAFAGAGGAAELHQLAGWGRDGHGLFFAPGGSAVWGPVVAQYLEARGVR